jgi:hypothetical protein
MSRHSGLLSQFPGDFGQQVQKHMQTVVTFLI